MAKTRESQPAGAGPLLVPVDFSADSEAALVFACRLAESLHASLLILHVVHDPGEAPGYYQVKGRKGSLRRLEDIAGDMLDDFMKRMRAEHPALKPLKKAESKLVVGLPVTRILEIVEREKPLMVVMGSAGRTGLARALLGSKAEQTVRMSPVPVTIVKSEATARKKAKAKAKDKDKAKDKPKGEG